MKRTLCILLAFAAIACGQVKENDGASGTLFDIYDSPAPSLGFQVLPERVLEDGGNRYVYNVASPTLELFSPETPDGSAVVILPGGGFCLLSYDFEGTYVARRLAASGITSFVLKYRTTPVAIGEGDEPSNIGALWQAINALTEGKERANALAFADADRAITFVREKAGEFGIDPDRIGIMGFSAGAMTTLHQIQFQSAESRPDFAGVIYGGWRGDFDTPEDPMPVFMCSPTNDIFTPEESLSVYEALRATGQPVEHHFFAKSEHGHGATVTGASVDIWPELFVSFLRDCGMVK